MGDHDAAAVAIDAFLRALGRDPDTEPELAGTPHRVADAFLSEFLSGYAVDTEALVAGAICGSGPDRDTLVAVRDIRLQTMCPHHLLPGLGTATVAYLPGEQLLGIGAIARLVDAYARRLTLQETICRQVVETLMTTAHARGAYCRVDLHHTCLSCRGARQPSAVVTTSKVAGCFANPDGEHRLLQCLAMGTSSG